MARDGSDEVTSVYMVLANREEQRALWPKSNAVPGGWRIEFEGSRSECGEYVNQHWTDIRPLSLRKNIEELEIEQPKQQAGA